MASATCCKVTQPDVSGPSAGPADLRGKAARDATTTALPVHNAGMAGLATMTRAGATADLAHRAPDVPLYLMNAAVLC